MQPAYIKMKELSFVSEIIKKQKFVIFTLIFSLIIFSVITTVFSIDKKTNRIITEYISSFGWRIEESPAEISHIAIPAEFDNVYKVYNSIQERSGFNLKAYHGKTVTRYTYRVLNHKYSKDSTVLAGVLFYKNKIIAADISSGGKHSFIHEIENTSEKLTE